MLSTATVPCPCISKTSDSNEVSATFFASSGVPGRAYGATGILAFVHPRVAISYTTAGIGLFKTANTVPYIECVCATAQISGLFLYSSKCIWHSDVGRNPVKFSITFAFKSITTISRICKSSLSTEVGVITT